VCWSALWSGSGPLGLSFKAACAAELAEPAGLLPEPAKAAPLSLSRTPRAAPSPFTVRLAADLPVTLVFGAVALGSELGKSELPGPYCGLSCDPQSINALDRSVVGNRLPGAALASDVLLGLGIGLPFALDLVDVLVSRPADGLSGYGQDVLVLAEVFAVNVGLNNLVKFAVRRPRPLAYDPQFDDADRTAPDSALSFYSGHSSTTFAMATAYSYLFMLRHPSGTGRKLVVPVWILSEGLAAATALLRVEAGKHFYTDVLTGALVGSALGLLIPYLHHLVLPSGCTLFSGLDRRRISVIPTLSSDGGGLLVSIY
jgi:membrane-associated phospholipid phosphatase